MNLCAIKTAQNQSRRNNIVKNVINTQNALKKIAVDNGFVKVKTATDEIWWNVNYI